MDNHSNSESGFSYSYQNVSSKNVYNSSLINSKSIAERLENEVLDAKPMFWDEHAIYYYLEAQNIEDDC